MKKRITSIILAACMFLLCSCGDKNPAKVGTGNVKTENQYVIAMNPSVAFEDGTVSSLRNDAARAISKDVSAKSATALYDDTNWKWIYADEDGQWTKRLVRQAALWQNGAGNTVKGAPYAYSVNDACTSSLAVFDTSKMKVEGCADGELPQNGVIMTFNGGYEEGLCYTADKDCTVTFSDTAYGNIAVVGKLAGEETAFFDKDGAASAIVLRVYRNGRIYWQGVLDKDNTAVEFPYLSEIELTAGDSIIISADAVNDTEGIVTGNCDLPATEKTVTKTVKHERKELVGYKDNQAGGTDSTKVVDIPFVEDGILKFTVVTPKGAAAEISKAVAKLRTGMKSALGEMPDTTNDEFDGSSDDYRILVYNTRFDASVKALNEIKTTRSANDGDFIIRMSGKDLVIAAGNEDSLESAVEFFLANYCKDENSVIQSNLNYVSANYNPLKDITLAGTPITEYKIVYSHVASFIETSAAKHIRDEIIRLCGKRLEMVNDSTKASANEIVVGTTNRTSSADYSNATNSTAINKTNDVTKLADTGYTVKVENGKTVILGEHIYAVNAGAIAFADTLKKNGSLNSGFELSGEYDSGYSLTNGYKLTWSDEFNAAKLSDVWQSKGTNVEKNVLGGKTTVVKANNVLENGALHQKVIRNGNDITVGSLYSTGAKKMMFQYGYLEIRAKLPTVKGIGASFWTQGDIASPFLEIDLYETFGDPFLVKSNLHTWGPGDEHRNLLGGDGGIHNNSEGVSKAFGSEYHTIGIEWDDDICTFYVDGQMTVTFDCSAETYNCFDKAAWLILNCDPCEPFYSSNLIDNSFTGDEASYDWIHIYQKEDNGSVMYQKK